jgi:hypothetical protein
MVEALKRKLLIALAIYAVCTTIFAWVAGPRLEIHTMNNHFAIQAEVWRAGRWYLTEEDIAGRHRRHEVDMGNDWAIVKHVDPQTGKTENRYFNSFPVFPAVLMYPFVAMAGSALMFRDALFVVGVAGIGPALLFLALERLREQGRSERSPSENAFLSLAFAFCTVFFFTAVQGTVWFAAHVVGVGLLCGYILTSLHAEKLWACLLAGVLVGCGWHTRPPFILGVALFAFEAARVSLKGELIAEGSVRERVRDAWSKLDKRAVMIRYVLFAAPILAAIGVMLAINKARFGNPFEFGHTLLNVVWMERVKRWGLFSYHYMSRNMTCAFTLLPIINPETAPAHVGRVQFSGNGVALWVTTPLYFWLIWPRVKSALHWALWAAALPIIVQDLMYQNSGWLQFGYRFSNDYAPYLFVLLAVGGRKFGVMFKAAAAWALAINTFGAVSFQRRGYEKYYYVQTYSLPVYDGTSGLQSATYPPD